jgi:hypothetical protein
VCLTGMLVADRNSIQRGVFNKEQRNESCISTLETFWPARKGANHGRICSSHNTSRCRWTTCLVDAGLEYLPSH